MHGATMPFAPTQSSRAQSGDPRRSLEERYASQEVYVELVTKAAEALIAEGYLLPVQPYRGTACRMFMYF